MAMLLAVFASHARAEESFNNDDWRGDTPDARPAIDETGPIYSANDHWVGTAMIVIFGLCLAAAVAGPMMQANALTPISAMPDNDPN